MSSLLIIITLKISRLSIRWVFYTLDEGYAYMLILPTCFIDKYLNTILLNLYKFWPVQVLVAISAEGCIDLLYCLWPLD